MARHIIRRPWLPAAMLLTTLWSTSVGAGQLSESVRDRSVGLNGSFEVTRKGLPVNWIVYTGRTVPDADARVTLDSTARHGANAMKFDVTRCRDTGGRLSPGLAQEVPVTAGGTYLVTVWMRNVGAGVLVRVNGVSASRRAPGPELRVSEDLEDWTAQTVTYQVPRPMTRLKVEINVIRPGTVWIDDISVVPVAD